MLAEAQRTRGSAEKTMQRTKGDRENIERVLAEAQRTRGSAKRKQLLLTGLGRALAVAFFIDAREIGGVFEAAGVGDFRDGEFALLE